MSKLSRVVKFIFAIWILAFALATPQAFQFGTVDLDQFGGVACTVIYGYKSLIRCSLKAQMDISQSKSRKFLQKERRKAHFCLGLLFRNVFLSYLQMRL